MEQQSNIVSDELAAFLRAMQNRIDALEATRVQQPSPSPPSQSIVRPPPHPSIKPNKPSIFDGSNSRNTDIWLFEVDMFFNASGVNDPQCVPIVVTFLRDVALQWWQAESNKHPTSGDNAQPPMTWESFKRAFRTRFMPIEASRTARTMLQNIRQIRSVTDYCARFQKQMALINDMAAADQVEYFVRGLQPNVQKEVVLRCPPTLDEAMLIATRYDSLTVLRGGFNNRNGQQSNNRSFQNYSSYGNNNRSNSSAFNKANPSTSVPMELGNMQTNNGDNNEDGNNSQQYASNNSIDGNSSQRSTNASTAEFNYIQAKQANGRVPGISRDEFQRCRLAGLCLRCKQQGHIARNCTNKPTYSNSSSGPKVSAQHK
jgi:hypothetical protein